MHRVTLWPIRADVNWVLRVSMRPSVATQSLRPLTASQGNGPTARGGQAGDEPSPRSTHGAVSASPRPPRPKQSGELARSIARRVATPRSIAGGYAWWHFCSTRWRLQALTDDGGA